MLVGDEKYFVLDAQHIGRFYVARCPFHTERTPSFTFDENGYHCFGCGQTGKHQGLVIEDEEDDE